MNLFQLLSLVVFALFIFNHFRTSQKEPFLKTLYGSRWLVIAFIGLLLIEFPEFSQDFASIFGIKYGVNLVIYISIIWIFYKLYKQSLQISKLEERLEKLVRKMALDDSTK